ncbi:MAG: hypothetical protein LBN07_04870 [Christensenellaceae bacterium]|jgi:hypothetical protein|nr:hypothetical protein [Christensenellaceae bacterium]
MTDIEEFNWKIFLALLFSLVLVSVLGFFLVSEYSIKNETFGRSGEGQAFEDENVYTYTISGLEANDQLIYTPDKLSKFFPANTSFNGLTNSYDLIVNNTPVFANFNAGRIWGTFPITLNGSNNETLASLSISFDLIFYSDRTELNVTIPTYGMYQNYIRSYFLQNGFNLRLIEPQFEGTTLDSAETHVFLYFYNQDNSLFTVKRAVLGTRNYLTGSNLPAVAPPLGFAFDGWSIMGSNVIFNFNGFLVTNHVRFYPQFKNISSVLVLENAWLASEAFTISILSSSGVGFIDFSNLFDWNFIPSGVDFYIEGTLHLYLRMGPGQSLYSPVSFVYYGAQGSNINFTAMGYNLVTFDLTFKSSVASLGFSFEFGSLRKEASAELEIRRIYSPYYF